MLLKRLACIAVLIFIPDYVLLQTVSERKDSDDFIPCEYGWFHYKGKCFKVSGKVQRLEWNKAADHCTALGGSLATIESKEENDFLVSLLLLEIQASAWIGLHDQGNESDYRWHSGSKSEYRNWRESEPSGFNRVHEDCAQLLVDLYQESVGEWNDNDCTQSIGFICEKKSNLEKKSPNLRNCSSTEGGGFRFKDSCYHFITELKSWEEAEQICIADYGGHLITVLDKTVDFYLKFLFHGIEAEYWIGIKLQEEFQQKWTSGWYVGYNGFKDQQQTFIEGTCVIRKQRKDWEIVSCSKKYSFICEKTNAKPPVLKPALKDSTCPSIPKGWRDFGGEFCYYIETSKAVTWYEANFECIRRDSYLLSLHSKEEIEILSPFIQYSHIASHIGLMRHFKQKGGEFKWVDGSELNLLNWAPGEPNNGNELCVESRSSDMMWNDIDCNQKRPFICSVRKVSPETTTESPFKGSVTPKLTTVTHFEQINETLEAPSSTTAYQSDDRVKTSGHVTHNILIGVVVFSLLVIIVLSIIIYKFKLCSKKNLNAQLQNYKDMSANEQDC